MRNYFGVLPHNHMTMKTNLALTLTDLFLCLFIISQDDVMRNLASCSNRMFNELASVYNQINNHVKVFWSNIKVKVQVDFHLFVVVLVGICFIPSRYFSRKKSIYGGVYGMCKWRKNPSLDHIECNVFMDDCNACYVMLCFHVCLFLLSLNVWKSLVYSYDKMTNRHWDDWQ